MYLLLSIQAQCVGGGRLIFCQQICNFSVDSCFHQCTFYQALEWFKTNLFSATSIFVDLE